MKYILEGNPVVLENVIREQRIRIARGQVKVSPASDCSEEREEELKSVTEERDELKSEVERLKSKIAEMEEASDTKELQEDTKDVSVDDSKDVSLEESDEKKPRKKTKE